MVNFKTLCRRKGLSSLDLQTVFENLRSAYEKSSKGDRYATKISERSAVVTAREDLSRDVEKIILNVWKLRRDPRSFRG